MNKTANFDDMPDGLEKSIRLLCHKAKNASAAIAGADTGRKNAVLAEMSRLLRENVESVCEANERDIEAGRDAGLSKAMLDRLLLDEKRISSVAEAIDKLIELSDPVGRGEHSVRPNGLVIDRIRVPLGTVGIIYEARPNVTVDAAALCIKTGNAVILRGGKEAIQTNIRLVEIMRAAVSDSGFPEELIGLVTDTSRDSAKLLMQMKGELDVLIPRGGSGLIKSVVENATVPVIETGAGNCHLYVHSDADIKMAVSVAVNAKVSRPSVCNAIENILVHSDVAREFLTAFAAAVREYGVEIRGCKRTLKILDGIKAATDEDFYTEYNDYIVSVKVVDSLDEAISHINSHSTGHSEVIITSGIQSADRFQREIDSAAVYVNASTRFTDGGEFGLGAEIGISTQKLHARGPMGLSALTTEKYLIRGNGQIR